MRSEYSKWFWSECDELNKDTSFAHNLAEKAWNYQQSKVDELQKQLIDQGQRFNDQAQRVKDLEYWNGELQKRVDAAIFKIKDYQEMNTDERSNLDTVIDVIWDLEQTLKGGG